MHFKGLPGEDLIEKGLRDLAQNKVTIESLLIAIGHPRLKQTLKNIPSSSIANPEHRLYDMLNEIDSDSAHSKYNALIRKLVSFERALDWVKK